CAACAPTTISPSIIRYGPLEPEKGGGTTLGLRTGPRLSTALAPVGSATLDTNDAWAFPQWSLAYDLAFLKPIDERTAMHFGAQGEFYYPFPLPAYGVYVGVSHARQAGPLSIAPALCVRGATDFGLSSIG